MREADEINVAWLEMDWIFCVRVFPCKPVINVHLRELTVEHRAIDKFNHVALWFGGGPAGVLHDDLPVSLNQDRNVELRTIRPRAKWKSA